MKLFNLGKKEECSCQNRNENPNARILVLGACCKKSQDSYANVCQAVKELNLNDEVSNIGDNGIIASFGVMQTPALVIDKKVVTYGKLITCEDAKKFILDSGVVNG